MAEILSHFGGYIGGVLAAIAAVIALYFKGKSAGKTEQQTKDQLDTAQQQVANTKAEAEHTVQVVKEVANAKQETNDLSDDDLRKRMRDNYTDK